MEKETQNTKSLSHAQYVANEMIKMFNKLEKDGVSFDHTLGIEENRRNLTFTKTLHKYRTEDVDKWLEQPSRFQKELRDLSLFLAQSNTIYFRALHYMASMAQICPVLLPNEVGDPLQMKKEYEEVASWLEKLNLSHEMVKVFASVFTEAVFFGLEYETDGSYYIKKLNPDYCMITATNDGAYCFRFDLSFFDRDTTIGLLESYHMIWNGFSKGYAKYRKNSKYRWLELPIDQTICIKINEASEHNIPPFVSVFGDLCHLADYKNLNKISVEQGKNIV